MQALRDDTYRRIADLMYSTIGLSFTDSKKPLVSSRLSSRIQRLGLGGFEEYFGLISGSNDGGEFQMAVDLLTTNETYFFREPQHFNDLAERLAAHPAGREFVVWSAASSSGEEAYSTAMLMADLLGDSAWQIIGTDLSTAMVESAQRGLYPLERARMVPPEYLRRFCLKGQGEHEGQLLVNRSLRERVRFEPANLMQTLPQLPMFDVIFLRNVLIYFDNDAKSQIVRRVLKQLKPQGVLYTGHAESLSTLGLPVRALATAIHVHA